MIKTFLARLTKPKVLLVLVISALLLGVTIYLAPKKLDEHGICWAKGRALSNEELYEAAMKDLLAKAIQARTVNKKNWESCSVYDWSCEFWIGAPVTEADIKEKMYSLIGQNGQQFISAIELKRLDDNYSTLTPKIKNNNFILISFDVFDLEIYTSDCCDGVYTYAELAELRVNGSRKITKDKINAINMLGKNIPSKQKYLHIRTYNIADNYFNHDSVEWTGELALRRAASARFYERFEDIDSCGNIKNNFLYEIVNAAEY